MYDFNTIVVGDALEFLKGLHPNSVPMFMFSPPYNLGTTSSGGMQQYIKGKGNQKGMWKGAALSNGYADHSDAMPDDQYVKWMHDILDACWVALSDDGAIYFNHKPRSQYNTMLLPTRFHPDLPVRQIIIWDRMGGINWSPSFYVPNHEWIVIYAKKDFRLKNRSASGCGDVWRFAPDGKNDHPAPFPVGLARRAIETVMPDFVVDPFMGSGTVAVAAKQLGIDFLGNELSASYVEKALKRIEKTEYLPPLIENEKVDQLDMFALEPA